MQLFSREKHKARSVEHETEYQPLEPIALCLALWLGAMVGVVGMVRFMDDAAQRRATANQVLVSTPGAYPGAAGI